MNLERANKVRQKLNLPLLSLDHKSPSVQILPIVVVWPLFLQPLKLFAKPDDKGLGDIVERTIGPIGGNLYNRWYIKTFGTKCPKCTEDKNNLNARYPL